MWENEDGEYEGSDYACGVGKGLENGQLSKESFVGFP